MSNRLIARQNHFPFSFLLTSLQVFEPAILTKRAYEEEDGWGEAGQNINSADGINRIRQFAEKLDQNARKSVLMCVAAGLLSDETLLRAGTDEDTQVV